jgi:hypothetical protein
MGTFDCESTICQTRLNLCGRFTRRQSAAKPSPIKWQTNFGVRLIVTSNGPKRECCYGKPGHKQPHARRTLCSSRILSVPKQSRRKFGKEQTIQKLIGGFCSQAPPGPLMATNAKPRRGGRARPRPTRTTRWGVLTPDRREAVLIGSQRISAKPFDGADPVIDWRGLPAIAKQRGLRGGC